MDDRSGAKIRKGLSLVELLVVIGIIGVLGGITFAIYSRAKEEGWKLKCASQMRQLAQAILMYVQDHDDLYPPPPVSVIDHLSPYLGIKDEDQLYRLNFCPKFPPEAEIFTDYEFITPAPLLFSRPELEQFIQKLGLDFSTFPMISESGFSTLFSPLGVDEYECPHFCGENVAFHDGHVKWLKCLSPQWLEIYNALDW